MQAAYPGVGEEDAKHLEVLHDIFSKLDTQKTGRVKIRPLLQKLEQLGMEEEDLRNFEERCDVMELQDIQFDDFIDFFIGDDEEDDEEDDDVESPKQMQRSAMAQLGVSTSPRISSSPSPHHTTMIFTPTRGKRSSLTRVRSLKIMASNNNAPQRGGFSRGISGTSPRAVPSPRSSSRHVVNEEILHLTRSNKMKRGRIEKAQVLLNRVQRRLESLQDQLIAADENDNGVTHSTREMMWIRKNNELQTKVDRLRAQIKRLQNESETLQEQLASQNSSIKTLEDDVQRARKLRITLQRRRSTMNTEANEAMEKLSVAESERMRTAQREISLLESTLSAKKDEVEDLKAKIAKQLMDLEQLRSRVKENEFTKKTLEETLANIQRRQPSPRRRLQRTASAFVDKKDAHPKVIALRNQTQELCKKIAQIEGIDDEDIRQDFANDLLAELKGVSQDMKKKVMTPRRYSDMQKMRSMARFKSLMVKKVSLTNLTAMSQSLVEAENSTDEEEEDEVPNLPPAELTEQDTKELLSQLLRQAVTQSAMDSAKREEEYNAAANTKFGKDRPQMEEGGFFCAKCGYANAFFRLTCRKCQARRYKYIGGMERARLASRANYVQERIANSGENHFYLATKKGVQWQIREYIIQGDSFACDITTPALVSWSPANVHQVVKKSGASAQNSPSGNRRSSGASEPTIRFKRLRYRFMVDIRCDKRTVEIAISPNIPPLLMRQMLLSQFERKIEKVIALKKAGISTPEQKKRVYAPPGAAGGGGGGGQNLANVSGSPLSEPEDEDDLVSIVPNLEDYGEVITKRYKADNEAVAKKCALLMTRARDCWAAQEFLKREEHERLTNCALWLDIIFAKYKQILEEILRNEESGQKVLIAEARVVRDKRFAGMGKRRRRSNPWADDTIDPCDTALAEAKIINMLQDATETRGGMKFDQVYPPYMEHEARKADFANRSSPTRSAQVTPTKKPAASGANLAAAALAAAGVPSKRSPRRSGGRGTPEATTPVSNTGRGADGLREPRKSASLETLSTMTVKGVMKDVRKKMSPMADDDPMSPKRKQGNGNGLAATK